jgi:hypothetical protein
MVLLTLLSVLVDHVRYGCRLGLFDVLSKMPAQVAQSPSLLFQPCARFLTPAQLCRPFSGDCHRSRLSSHVGSAVFCMCRALILLLQGLKRGAGGWSAYRPWSFTGR